MYVDYRCALEAGCRHGCQMVVVFGVVVVVVFQISEIWLFNLLGVRKSVWLLKFRIFFFNAGKRYSSSHTLQA